ncbi:SRPBCC family protein [Pseudomonas putida]|uniref:SRPBCC family protein n=1 Tax=Pseudomonas putida TaxID=303 RepID=A0A8I1EG28_PSEPU|nr:SRPBCC family protein [Pseudomonas putida]
MPAIEFSSVIESTVEQVWRLLRDFKGIGQWRAEIVGGITDFRYSTGQYVREVMVSHGSISRERRLKVCDHEMSVSFMSVGSTFQYGTYRVFVQVHPTTRRAASVVSWICYYAPRSASEVKSMEHILHSYIIDIHHQLSSSLTHAMSRNQSANTSSRKV